MSSIIFDDLLMTTNRLATMTQEGAFAIRRVNHSQTLQEGDSGGHEIQVQLFASNDRDGRLPPRLRMASWLSNRL
jgi:hypothetical protein